MSEQEQLNQHQLQRFGEGKEEAFDYFFRLYYQRLCFYARKILDHGHEAEDLVQECFVTMWNKRISFDEIGAIQSYLFRAVHNACVSAKRKKQIIRFVDEVPETSDGEISGEVWEAELIQAEMMANLYADLRGLPARIREVCELYYLFGKNVQEISELLHTSPNTIRIQRRRGIELLRERFQ